MSEVRVHLAGDRCGSLAPQVAGRADHRRVGHRLRGDPGDQHDPGLTAKQNDSMAEEDRKLNIEWRHLLLEQGTLAEHSRVASLAMDKLQMARPLVTTEKVITQP